MTVTELHTTRTHWLRRAQQSAFSADLKCVTDGPKPPRDSSLCDVAPYIDDEGVFWIKSRLHSANTAYDERNPIVLAKQHKYPTLLTATE